MFKKVTLLALSALLAFTAPAMAAKDLDLTSPGYELNIGTGSEGNAYWNTGQAIRTGLLDEIARHNKRKSNADNQLSNNVEVWSTSGSGRNIELFNAGDVDIIGVQGDMLNVNKPTRPFSVAKSHPEYVFWLYSLEHGVEDLSDMSDKDDLNVAIDVDSGAYGTWRSFMLEDDSYEDIGVSTYNELFDVANAVCTGFDDDGNSVAGMVYVGKSVPQEVLSNFSKCIGVGEATDKDFDDAKDVRGKPLYEKCDIPTTAHPGMSKASWGEQETVCVNSFFLYTKGKSTSHSIVKRAVVKALR